MKAIYIQRHGAVSDLTVSDVAKPSSGPDEVLVKVEAAGVNPSDIVSVEGRFPAAVLPRIVGRDFAGHVVDGPAELIGTEVWGTGGDLGISRNGTHAEYLAIPSQAVSRPPKSLSAEQASAVGVPFVTAFSALVSLGKLKESEWVIVSGAAGAVGQAAIQIAQAKGAGVIALVRDANNRLPPESGEVAAVAHSDKRDLEAMVKEVTNGKGANLALNGVGSSIFGPILAALGTGGRQVLYSVAEGREATLDILQLYKNQFALFGLDTQKFDAVYCSGILNGFRPMFESGVIKPPTITERYELSQAAKAYARVASGGGGKVVLRMPSYEAELAGQTSAKHSNKA